MISYLQYHSKNYHRSLFGLVLVLLTLTVATNAMRPDLIKHASNSIHRRLGASGSTKKGRTVKKPESGDDEKVDWVDTPLGAAPSPTSPVGPTDAAMDAIFANADFSDPERRTDSVASGPWDTFLRDNETHLMQELLQFAYYKDELEPEHDPAISRVDLPSKLGVKLTSLSARPDRVPGSTKQDQDEHEALHTCAGVWVRGAGTDIANGWYRRIDKWDIEATKLPSGLSQIERPWERQIVTESGDQVWGNYLWRKELDARGRRQYDGCHIIFTSFRDGTWFCRDPNGNNLYSLPSKEGIYESGISLKPPAEGWSRYTIGKTYYVIDTLVCHKAPLRGTAPAPTVG